MGRRVMLQVTVLDRADTLDAAPALQSIFATVAPTIDAGRPHRHS